MKELSIEEKAKAYDRAIEELRGLLEGIHEEKCEIMEEDITNIFPELKESESEDEEERIRNYILSHFQEHLNKIDEFIREGMTAPFSSEEIKMLEASVAWLEKQGEYVNFLDKIQIGDKVTRNENGMLVNLSQLNRVAKKDEKQSEKKPILDVEIPFGAKDSELQEASYYIPEGFHAEIDGNRVVIKKDAEKPANIEPKFKAGDWIVSNEHPNCGNSLMRIVEVGLTDYLCRYYNGQTTYCREFIDKSYHLWTIQDAKDGDVLVYDNGCVEIILLFKKWRNEVGKGAYSYAHITSSWHHINTNDWSDCGLSAHPATKEQRDLLFQKMREAGYEWNNDKKELKKIEQKFTPKYKNGDCIEYRGEKYKITKVTVTPHNFFYDVSLIEAPSDLEEVVTRIGMAAEEQMFKIEQKSTEWSGQDEMKCNNIIALVEGKAIIRKDIKGLVSWLNSLKNRVQPQQEWSEEEVEIIDWLVASFDCLKIPTDTFYQSKVRPFLISLRNKIQPIRKEWSEEDEKYLKHAIEDFQKLGDSYLTFWVKSLKNRCITLPIQEWNEKDDRLLRVCVAAINGIDNFCPENKQELTDWLKSLRPQPQWKPSELQIEALESATENCAYSEYQNCLRELSGQLKKLREE